MSSITCRCGCSFIPTRFFKNEKPYKQCDKCYLKGQKTVGDIETQLKKVETKADEYKRKYEEAQIEIIELKRQLEEAKKANINDNEPVENDYTNRDYIFDGTEKPIKKLKPGQFLDMFDSLDIKIDENLELYNANFLAYKQLDLYNRRGSKPGNKTGEHIVLNHTNRYNEKFEISSGTLPCNMKLINNGKFRYVKKFGSSIMFKSDVILTNPTIEELMYHEFIMKGKPDNYTFYRIYIYKPTKDELEENDDPKDILYYDSCSNDFKY
jgi:hypothetical protein